MARDWDERAKDWDQDERVWFYADQAFQALVEHVNVLDFGISVDNQSQRAYTLRSQGCDIAGGLMA